MDNLAHSLAGAAMGYAGPARKYGRGAVATLVLASNLPDLDVLWTLPDGLLSGTFRRGPTHSLLGGPLLCAAFAWLMQRRHPHLRYGTVYGLSLLGWAVHVVFDLLNSYGVMLCAPAWDHRFEWSMVFIIDLAFWGLLGGPLLWAAAGRRWWPGGPWADRERLARVGLAGLALYLAAVAGLKGRAERALADHPACAGASFLYVFPEALGPHRFRGVARTGDVWALYRIGVPSGTVVEHARYGTQEAAPAVRAARASAEGRRLDWFFKAPVWTADGGTVRVFDLRFTSTVLPWRAPPFAFEFFVAPDGAVTGPRRAAPKASAAEPASRSARGR